ncbi:MAG: ABC transporter ATP-binding protein, partial [Cypionkella sp.]|nr:ABC transporter ATP-binding protein [Cypionkella sp.]
MNDRVVAFDVNAGCVAAAGDIAARTRADTRVPQGRHNARAQSRAQLTSVYAGLCGVDLAVSDVVEQIQLASDAGQLGLPEVARALRSCGVAAQVDALAAPGDAHWPALAEMTSGQIVLVLGETSDGVEVYDTTVDNKRAEVPHEDFAQVYAGRILRVRTSVKELETRHVEAAKTPHWFWGEFPRFKRQLGEVAAGSL